jgi:hypothetical protein
VSLFGRLLKSIHPARAPSGATLFEIFQRNTRKDIHKWHHYFDVYERFLSPLRGKPVTLLEIGMWRGGSLRMWQEYLGGTARIYGMDVDPGCTAYAPDGVSVFIGDQRDRDFLRKVKESIGEIDVVIDDGGHTMAQQINTFEELYPVTRQLFLVEDTHTSYWPRYMDMGAATFIDFAKTKVDALHEWHRDPESFQRHCIAPAERTSAEAVSDFCATTRGVHFYDSMVVFEKGPNPPRWAETR